MPHTSILESNPPVDEPALLAQRHRLKRLKFPQPLEDQFLSYLHRKMCNRVWAVGLSTIGFMLLFIWVDYRFLPRSVYELSIPLRIAALVCVAFSIWFTNRPGKVSPRPAFTVATIGYLSTGWMVAGVILLCRVKEVSVPVTHDGLYIVLLSGSFLLGLPTRHAVLSAWLITLGYLLGEALIGSSGAILIGNCLFLASFVLMGCVGAYAYEHMLRGAFLNEQLLNAARHRAERESQSKTRFLATASHDLRQPMHAMALFIQHLQEQVTEPRALNSIARLAESAQLLQAMLGSLLDMSRLSVGMVEPHPRHTNLHAWLQRILSSFEVSAQAQGMLLQLECSQHTAVYTDPLLLERLVRNYLSNALVHSGATQVKVIVEDKGAQLRISVVDNGRGLSAEDQSRIFDEFTQLSNPARSLDKGVGLGLSICRQLLHLLEYPSGLASAPGEGACFWVEVPRGVWQTERGPELAGSTASLGGRILLVENDLVNREATEALLRHWGCEVECHADGAQLLDAAQPRDDIDVLLTDYHLEGPVNGLQLIAALREKGIYTGPATLVTADTSAELEREAAANEALIIHKPVLPARLRRAVQSQLVYT